ncbi:hypothetical protein K474DRAFT_1713741 [Panus rudis PR-1116 ss-1]|nr:hypothetical protein K474DRAFT_1713741 [Panus rudis PR-1116 ss-1]
MTDPPPPTRRSVRTYGRSRAPVADTPLDADTSLDVSGHSDSSFNAGLSSDGAFELPPSSDHDISFHSAKDADDEDEDSHGERGTLGFKPFEYIPLKERLKRLEKELDEKESMPESRNTSDVCMSEDKETHSALNKVHESEAVAQSQQHTRTSNSPQRLPSSHSSPLSLSATRSQSPADRAAKRRVRRLAQSDSDSEPNTRPSTPQTSPAKLHHITTPNTRSSPTPPTSEEMAPSRKGKGKAPQNPIPRLFEDMPAHPDDERPTQKASTSRGGKRKSKEPKVKAPTKKELLETRKATARMQAERNISIPRVQHKPLPLSNLLHRVGHVFVQRQDVEEEDGPSSPIQDFSSPAAANVPGPSKHITRALPLVPMRLSRSRSRTPDERRGQSVEAQLQKQIILMSDDDDDLPDAKEIFAERAREEELAKRKQQLREAKLKALQQQQLMQARAMEQDDESDLEIHDDMTTVVKEEAESRRKSAIHGVKTPSKKRKSRIPDNLPSDYQQALLAEAAKPAFLRASAGEKDAGRRLSSIGMNDLNRLLLHNASEVSAKIIEQKEREWVSKGGKVMEKPDKSIRDMDAMRQKLAELAAQGVSREEGRVSSNDEDTDEEDGDWQPAQDAHADNENVEQIPDWNQFAGTQTDDDEDEENRAPLRSRYKARPSTVLDSDDERENMRTELSGRVLVPSTSTILPESPNPQDGSDKENAHDTEQENETDKENDASRMFDRGEDKENTAISQEAGRIPQPVFRPSRRASFSSDDERPAMNVLSPENRTPLREITSKDDEEDPFGSTPLRSMLPPSQPFSPTLATPSRKQPMFVRDGEPSRAFGVGHDFALTLEPAADILPSPARSRTDGENAGVSPVIPSALDTDNFSQFVTPAKGAPVAKKPMPANSLELTLDGGPATLELSHTARKKADDIFAREQELALMDAERPKEPEMFVNQHGFLTQTKPAEFSPAVSEFPSSVQKSQSLLDSVLRSKQRPPLRPLEFTEDLELDTPFRPNRLRKRASSPDLADALATSDSRSSPSPSPTRKQNAFNVLMQQKKSTVSKPKKKLDRSEFVEGEAEESDEDAMFGFGGPKKKAEDDEEVDGEDLDATLEELMDDKEMDADTLNEEKVLEKVKEHLEEDDANLERIHRAAVEGKLRAAKRDRTLNYDSDSDIDEDEANARRRQKLKNKKRRLDGGDSLDQIAENEETRPFAATYYADLANDDAPEFAHLEHEDAEIVIRNDEHDEEEDEAEQEEDEEDEDLPPRTVRAADLRAELQRAARGETSHTIINPNDVSWVMDDEDMDVEEEHIRIKEVSHAAKKASVRRQQNDIDINADVKAIRPQIQAQSTKWASRARAEGTSTATGRPIAITGHSLTKAKTGSGSIVGSRGASSTSNSKGKQPQAASAPKARSALSAVSSRKDRFGN